MWKLFIVMFGLALLAVAAVRAMTDTTSEDKLAEMIAEERCRPVMNGQDEPVHPPEGTALASETKFTENLMWRRYIKISCFIGKKVSEYELHYRPMQFSLWL